MSTVWQSSAIVENAYSPGLEIEVHNGYVEISASDWESDSTLPVTVSLTSDEAVAMAQALLAALQPN